MADINQQISLGIGTPSDIAHFTLFGLTPVSAVNGQLTATIDPFTLSATGTLDISGSLSATIDAFTLTSTGTLDITGSLSASIGTFTLTATGGQPLDASTIYAWDTERQSLTTFRGDIRRLVAWRTQRGARES